jgi:2-C-methyl-D-erythritol 4-phosphate cytidylyltransferase
MSTAAVVAAAGLGTRLGGGQPKAFRLLGGAPLLVHAVGALQASSYVAQVVVAAPRELLPEVARLLGPGVTAVAGGADRQQSVAAALSVLPADVEAVLVHDAARPLVPFAVVDAVARAVLAGAPAVIPVLPVVDTLKRVRADGAVAATVSRTELRAVQTPQGFNRAVLERAHRAAAAGDSATDDAGLVERLGITVVTVPGSAEALKITTPFDLLVAEAILARRSAP